MKSKKEIKDYNLPYEISEEDLHNNSDKVRETFVKNMEHSKQLRYDMWERLYARKFMRKDLSKIQQAEDEWNTMNYEERLHWFDFVTNKDLGFIKELLLITNLIKSNKGNIKNVWRDLKQYGKEKK